MCFHLSIRARSWRRTFALESSTIPNVGPTQPPNALVIANSTDVEIHWLLEGNPNTIYPPNDTAACDWDDGSPDSSSDECDPSDPESETENWEPLNPEDRKRLLATFQVRAWVLQCKINKIKEHHEKLYIQQRAENNRKRREHRAVMNAKNKALGIPPKPRNRKTRAGEPYKPGPKARASAKAALEKRAAVLGEEVESLTPGRARVTRKNKGEIGDLDYAYAPRH